MEKDIEKVVALLEKCINDLRLSGFLSKSPLQNPAQNSVNDVYLKLTSAISILHTGLYRMDTISQFEKLLAADGR